MNQVSSFGIIVLDGRIKAIIQKKIKVFTFAVVIVFVCGVEI